MAIIQHKYIFSWKNFENIGDLERFKLLIKYLPDEKLMRALESKRNKGRNDYPIRAIWNSLLASVIYQHQSIESLRRELLRNPLLMGICGFELHKSCTAIPSANAYTNFLKNLYDHSELLDEMFESLVSKISSCIDGFGKTLAIDSKAIRSLSRYKSKKQIADNRRDIDGDYGVKNKITHKGQEKLFRWFGYKLHLIVDADTELPLSYSLTKASSHDGAVAKELFDNPKVAEKLKDAEYLLADRGYDDKAITEKLQCEHNVKPVIDIRNCHKDKQLLSPVKGYRNVFYNYRGDVCCRCKKSGEYRDMVYVGYEKDRASLKYRCPAENYGLCCQSYLDCPVNNSLRIKLSDNPRVFTALPRNTLKWSRIYNKRSSVERCFARIDRDFGFEKHYIRGMDKMKTRCLISLIIMLTIAYGRAKEGEIEHIRSLTYSKSA